MTAPEPALSTPRQRAAGLIEQIAQKIESAYLAGENDGLPWTPGNAETEAYNAALHDMVLMIRDLASDPALRVDAVEPADVWAWILALTADEATVTDQVLKVAEEAGEVCGAFLKNGPGREVVEEIADLHIALMGLVGALGIEAEWDSITAARWATRRSR